MSSLKPGDFPLGSALSRAAARMLLNSQPDSRKRIEVITNVMFPDLNGVLPDKAKPYATPWIGDDKMLMRILYVPEGMSEEEARKIFREATD
jgi:hypothetical protein